MKEILFASIISFITLNDIDAQGTWTQKANFGGPSRFVAAAFSIGNKGYIGTGRDGSSAGFSKDFWEWDQTNDTWTQKANFGGAKKMAAAGFSIGSKGYIGTGWDINLVFTQDLWEYDPASNTWTQQADFAGTGRYRATAFSIGTKGYISTGYNGLTYFNDFWEWDQTTNTWSQKADFPGAARLSPVGFAIGSKGYIGTGGDGNFTVNYNDFWEWDQASNTWTQMANFPGTARMGASGFAIGCKGYVGTGVGSGGTSYNDFWEYDPSTDTWTQQADYGGGAEAQAVGFSIGNKGYIGTGQNMNSDFWEFTPDSVCALSSPGFSVSDTTLCEKFCTSFIDQSTNNPTSWLWLFPGGSPSSSTDQNPIDICYDTPGTYDVTLITTNAFGSDTLTLANYITVYPTPPFPTITQNGNVLTCSPAANYQWQFNTVNIPGATMQSYTYTQPGLYTVLAGDSNGCTNYANLLITLVGNVVNNFTFSVFPNPAGGNFTVELLNCPADKISLRIVNTIGKEILSSEERANTADWKKVIDLCNAADGVYFIKIRMEDEFACPDFCEVRKKIIVAK